MHGQSFIQMMINKVSWKKIFHLLKWEICSFVKDMFHLLCVLYPMLSTFYLPDSPESITAQIWHKGLDLYEFLDEYFNSCTLLPFEDDAHLQSTLVLMTTTHFKSMQLRLWLQNLSAEPVTMCKKSLLVLTQASELQMGRGDCCPICGSLETCDFVSMTETGVILRMTQVINFWHCHVHLCQSVAIHIPRSVAQDMGKMWDCPMFNYHHFINESYSLIIRYGATDEINYDNLLWRTLSKTSGPFSTRGKNQEWGMCKFGNTGMWSA